MPTVVIEPRAKKIVRHIQGPAGIGDPTNIDFLKFNLVYGTPDPSAVSQVFWDADAETLSLVHPGGVVQQIGQETYWHVRNNSGALITDGTPVMATGTIGASGRITIDKMDGSDTDNARRYLGVATEDIADGADGKVTGFGIVRGIDLSSFNDGEILYIDPGVLGGLTATKPSGQKMVMSTALVIDAVPSGTLAVRVTPRDEAFFSGVLSDYNESSSSISFTAGAASVDYTATDNIIDAILTQDSTITLTNIPNYKKPLTIAVTQTGGPWDLSIAYGAKTLALTVNGTAGQALETFEIWTDGTDIFAPSGGGVLWDKGA